MWHIKSTHRYLLNERMNEWCPRGARRAVLFYNIFSRMNLATGCWLPNRARVEASMLSFPWPHFGSTVDMDSPPEEGNEWPATVTIPNTGLLQCGLIITWWMPSKLSPGRSIARIRYIHTFFSLDDSDRGCNASRIWSIPTNSGGGNSSSQQGSGVGDWLLVNDLCVGFYTSAGAGYARSSLLQSVILVFSCHDHSWLCHITGCFRTEV